MVQALDVVLQGALVGGLYALYAAGLSLTFGVMRLVNLAHGDLIVLAAFLAVLAVEATGLPALATALLVAPAMAAIGYALQRLLLNPALGGGEDVLRPLLVTFGLSILLQNGLLETFRADSRKLQAGALETASLALLPGLGVGWLPLLVMAVAVAVIAALQALIHRSRFGAALRATSDDAETVQLMGVARARVFAWAAALAAGVSGVAGVLMGTLTNFDPGAGAGRLLYAFEAVIIGGLGSLWGTLAGGVILGVAQAVGAALDPGWQVLAGHLAFLLVLVLRPRGLFPRMAG